MDEIDYIIGVIGIHIEGVDYVMPKRYIIIPCYTNEICFTNVPRISKADRALNRVLYNIEEAFQKHFHDSATFRLSKESFITE